MEHRSIRTVTEAERIVALEREVAALRLQNVALKKNADQLFDLIQYPVLVIESLRVRAANPAANSLFGADILRSDVLLFFIQQDRGVVSELLSTCLNNSPIEPIEVISVNGKVTLFANKVINANFSEAVHLIVKAHTDQYSLQSISSSANRAEETGTVLQQATNEHQLIQDELRHSRQFARSVIDSSLDMILAANKEGYITEYNPAAALCFGWEPSEIIGKNTVQLYANKEQFEYVQRELNVHGVFTGEVQNISKFGEEFTSFLAASKLYDEDGTVIGVMGVSRDISQTKRDEFALKASEEKYRDLFENASDMIQSVDASGKFEYVNEAWKQALGYTDQELENMTVLDIVVPEKKGTYAKQRAEILSGKRSGRIETMFLAKNGDRVFVEGTSNARIENGVYVATRSILHNVTNVHTAKEKVRVHEAKLKALFESSEHLFWTVDKDIKLTSYNNGYRAMINRLYGVDPEINLEQDKPRKYFAEDEYHAFWEAQYAIAFSGKPVQFETDRTDTNGERVCNEIFLSPVFAEDGSVPEVFGVGHEITDKKTAEELVTDQGARLKSIFESTANVMIWTLDTEFRITSFNEHFRASTERSLQIDFKKGDDFVDIMRSRVVDGKDGVSVSKYATALTGTPQHFEAELIGKNGRSIWVETFLNPIVKNGKVTEISCIGYGITDRKESQLKLMQSLGEKEVLLKEVHHRVKNNLQIISSILSLQSAHVGNDERILELLRVSRDRIRSMSFIHESLYQTKDFSSIDLANYIDGLSSNLMMSYSLNGKVALRKDLQPTHLVLDQAIPCGLILNELISNALKHAFPENREGEVRIQLQCDEKTVRVTVSDNGVGVKHDFDDEQDGNLGLELVYTLAEQLDGKIQRINDEGVTYLLTFDRL